MKAQCPNHPLHNMQPQPLRATSLVECFRPVVSTLVDITVNSFVGEATIPAGHANGVAYPEVKCLDFPGNGGAYDGLGDPQ